MLLTFATSTDNQNILKQYNYPFVKHNRKLIFFCRYYPYNQIPISFTRYYLDDGDRDGDCYGKILTCKFHHIYSSTKFNGTVYYNLSIVWILDCLLGQGNYLLHWFNHKNFCLQTVEYESLPAIKFFLRYYDYDYDYDCGYGYGHGGKRKRPHICLQLHPLLPSSCSYSSSSSYSVSPCPSSVD
jgi:hypothetical protein